MTLDEAIKHCEEVADEKNKEACNLYDAKNYEESRDCIWCSEEHRQLAEWLKELKQLREQTRWILVSERMPEEREIGTKRFRTIISDEVYVTLENLKGEKYTKHLCFQNGKLSPSHQQELDAFYNGGIPIAWMPLPEPYEPQERRK